DDNIVHVSGAIDPLRDIEVINTELILADLDTVERRLTKTLSMSKSGAKLYKQQAVFLENLKNLLNEGKPARLVEADEIGNALLKELFLLTAKPVLYVANVHEDDIVSGNEWVQQVQELATAEGAESVMISGAIEEQLMALEPEERQEFLADLGLTEPGLNRLIHAGYKLLGLITYFTVGEKETKAWTIRRGTKAPQAAGVIHTDFEKGFIRAEVIAYEDYVACGSEAKVKEKGLMRLEGKEYVVKDGDCMNFRFNV
ncbi:MAG: redox-regulated ATPase YchF, partial [Deltaproteobacteria bacterium]